MIRWLVTRGAPWEVVSRMRKTVAVGSVSEPSLAPPLSTLLTKSVVVVPFVTVAISQGPSTSGPVIVSTGWPTLLRTIRQPYFAVADRPLVVGRLPTTTYPWGRTPNAVV